MLKAILLLGSNIQPRENLRQALEILRTLCEVSRASGIYQTKAVGSSGPDFLNQAVLIRTDLSKEEIKEKIATPIEVALRRDRVGDRYAPRTIDVDLVILNGEVLDEKVWTEQFSAQPVSDIAPDMLHPVSRKPLREIARQLAEEKGTS